MRVTLISRIMPGVKDVVSIKIDGKRVLKQKRLLLLDLNDIYSTLTKSHPEFSVSFSKFAQLRPKYCVLMGNRGTHAVCLCTHHQNCYLMFDAFDIENLSKDSGIPMKNYKDCMSQIICKDATSECHLDECGRCPGTKDLSNHLVKCFEDNNIF